MTVTLKLPPEMEARVQEEAAKHCLPVEEYLLRLVQEAIPSTEAEKRQRSLELLRSAGEIGDAEEQRQTFEYLKTAVDADRLSKRKRFA